MADPIDLRAGDRLPDLTATLQDANGPVDVSGATVRLVVVSWNRRTLVLDVEADNLDNNTEPNRGKVRYQWASGDVAVLLPGHYRAWWEATFGDGRKLTFANDDEMVLWVNEGRPA